MAHNNKLALVLVFVLSVLCQWSTGIKIPSYEQLAPWYEELSQFKVKGVEEETFMTQEDFNKFVEIFSLGFLESYKENSGELNLDPLLNSLDEKKIEIYQGLKFPVQKVDVEVEKEVSCSSCKLTIRPIQAIWFRNETQEAVISLVKKVCPILENLNVVAFYICEGAIDTFAREVIQIVGHLFFEPLEVCAFRDQCTKEIIPPFQVSFPKPKPAVNPPKPPTNETERRYIIQFTDIHYDPFYTVGLEGECGEPVCCRPPNPIGVIRPAGRWGDYQCDSPRDLLVDMFKFASQLPYKFEFGIWSGDIPPHDVWESKKDNYIELMSDMATLLQETFQDTQFFAAVGNHESIPVDFFAPRSINDEFSLEWLYNSLADQWSPWLPSSAIDSIRQNGNYDVTLRSGIRVVSLNDEGCSNNNQWLRMRWEGVCCEEEKPDPDNSLTWLINILQDAEDNGQIVHLIRHVPNSNRCTKEWSDNFYEIVNRYESTIAAIYSGHVHNDDFIIHYRDGSERTQPTVVEYITPSATPYTKGNPAFRIYEIDWETKLVVNHLTYYTNLTEANELGKPIWKLEYSANEAFNMENTLPESWHKLTVEFEQDQEKFDKYFEYYHKSHLAGRTCDEECRLESICRMRTARTKDPCTLKVSRSFEEPTFTLVEPKVSRCGHD